jgi:hypothetical protein
MRESEKESERKRERKKWTKRDRERHISIRTFGIIRASNVFFDS